MKLMTLTLALTVLTTQSFAGELPVNRGRPGLPIETTILKAEVKPYSGDLALFDSPNLAYVTIDTAVPTMKIELYYDSCSNALGLPTCLAMPTLLSTYEVPLESIEPGTCGSVVYTGSVNMMPIDGPAFSLTVKDNRDFANHCASARAVAPTTGLLKVEAPRGGQAKQMTFEGDLLR